MTGDPVPPDCVLCRIVAGQAPCHRIWEDERHLAFLSIFPNTEGFSVVVTKEHRPSYVADLEPEDSVGLHLAAGQVARLLNTALPDVGRTGIIYEGFGIDHAHAKLFPMHGTADTHDNGWREIKSSVDVYFDCYEGYISSHDHKRADDTHLSSLATRIRTAGQTV